MINRTDAFVISIGLTIRILIGLVSSHPYDSAQFAISQRLYFQYGIIDIKYFPTMPLLYYVQLPFYSMYTLLVRLGLPDYQQFYRSTLMIEGLFLKLPLILCDLGSFFVIRALTQRRIPAILYFFNP